MCRLKTDFSVWRFVTGGIDRTSRTSGQRLRAHSHEPVRTPVAVRKMCAKMPAQNAGGVAIKSLLFFEVLIIYCMQLQGSNPACSCARVVSIASYRGGTGIIGTRLAPPIRGKPGSKGRYAPPLRRPHGLGRLEHDISSGNHSTPVIHT